MWKSKRIMTMSERSDLVQRIRQLPQQLEAAAANLDAKKMDTPTGEGKWTIRQLVHHIADAHVNAYVRMKLIATEEKPILKPYSQDAWAALADSKSGEIATSLAIVKGVHERWFTFLQSLPETAWTREGIHLENGKVTLESLLKSYVKHGDSHVQQITLFRERMKW
jgi:uncharacterized damage-inducible protein DinB